MISHKLSPFGIYGIRIIAQPHHQALDSGKNPVCMSGKKPQSVVAGWSRANGPTFNQVLRGHTENVSSFVDAGDRVPSLKML